MLATYYQIFNDHKVYVFEEIRTGGDERERKGEKWQGQGRRNGGVEQRNDKNMAKL